MPPLSELALLRTRLPSWIATASFESKAPPLGGNSLADLRFLAGFVFCVSAGRATPPVGVSPERGAARAHADACSLP